MQNVNLSAEWMLILGNVQALTPRGGVVKQASVVIRQILLSEVSLLQDKRRTAVEGG
jgi:hypothetical protein